MTDKPTNAVVFAVVEVYRGVADEVKLFVDEQRALSHLESVRARIDTSQDDIQLFECPIDDAPVARATGQA
jgi:hypothetical protein